MEDSVGLASKIDLMKKKWPQNFSSLPFRRVRPPYFSPRFNIHFILLIGDLPCTRAGGGRPPLPSSLPLVAMDQPLGSDPSYFPQGAAFPSFVEFSTQASICCAREPHNGGACLCLPVSHPCRLLPPSSPFFPLGAGRGAKTTSTTPSSTKRGRQGRPRRGMMRLLWAARMRGTPARQPRVARPWRAISVRRRSPQWGPLRGMPIDR